MFTYVSQTSRHRLHRKLGITMTSAVVVLALIRSISIAAEQEEAGELPVSDLDSVQLGPVIPIPYGRAAAVGAKVATAQETLGPATVVPLAEQPPAAIYIDPPLPDQLAKGLVVIQYRTENLRMMPVFGAAALAVSPRIGHIHLTLDDGPMIWANTSGQELVINGLPSGPHKILIELVNANHKALAQGTVNFEVPALSFVQSGTVADESHAALASPQHGPLAQEKLGHGETLPTTEQPPAKIFADPPVPHILARGVVFIEYRTENLQIQPVYGVAGLAVSPRIGHVHVTVDDALWHWTDASGGPVIVSGLAPGPHKVQIDLVNANHQTLAQNVVKFEVPQRSITRPDSKSSGTADVEHVH